MRESTGPMEATMGSSERNAPSPGSLGTLRWGVLGVARTARKRIKTLKVCFWAHAATVVGETVAMAQVWNVRKWDSSEIQAEQEENLTSDCERNL